MTAPKLMTASSRPDCSAVAIAVARLTSIIMSSVTLEVGPGRLGAPPEGFAHHTATARDAGNQGVEGGGTRRFVACSKA
jgi:hypothetical protein